MRNAARECRDRGQEYGPEFQKRKKVRSRKVPSEGLRDRASTMPKAAKQASRVAAGGYSKRRKDGATTPKGRERSAPRWTTAAAIAFTRAMTAFIADNNNPATNKTEAIRLCLHDKPCLEQMLRYEPIAKATGETRKLIRDIMEAHWAVVQKRPACAQDRATGIRGRVYSHTGPLPVEEVAPAETSAQPERPANWWIDQPDRPFPKPREAPDPEGAMLREMATWGLERIELEEHDVIVYERAHNRVRDWRKKNRRAPTAKPGIALARSLIHRDRHPTALANKGDHFYRPKAGRWVTPTELARLFGVPEDASLMTAIRKPDFRLNAIGINNALGRAVKIESVKSALRATGLDRSEPLRYSSACSGLDLFAVEIERQWHEWSYLRASEKREDVADALQSIYAHRGLERQNIDSDATIPRDAPMCDLWVATPPCEKFSSRNHAPSAEGRLDAALDFQDMMWFPRTMRPRVIIVENVDQPGARESIEAALYSLPGYTWQQFAVGEPEEGEMRRKRRYWIGKRE